MSDEFDWLETDEKMEAPAAQPLAPLKPKRKRRPAELVKAEKALTPAQRYYVRCILESETLQRANRAFYDSGYKCDRVTLYRWRMHPKFIKALKLSQDYLFESLGLDKSKVMLDAEKLKQLALTPRPILHKGEYTGFDEIELGAALRALELQAKGVGIGNEDKQRVVVAIDIDFSGRRDDVGVTIDGELADE